MIIINRMVKELLNYEMKSKKFLKVVNRTIVFYFIIFIVFALHQLLQCRKHYHYLVSYAIFFIEWDIMDILRALKLMIFRDHLNLLLRLWHLHNYTWLVIFLLRLQPGRPWILMTGHGISCQKSKFLLSLLFTQIFSCQYAVLLFAEQFSLTFFLMKCFFLL